MKIVLAGGTGFIGHALLKKLSVENHQVVLLSRNPQRVPKPLCVDAKVVAWDGRTSGDWCSELEAADAVINLCGESVAAKRWTKEYKAKMFSSRIKSTQVLVQAIQASSRKPKVLINASAAGYYGAVAEDEVTETHAKGEAKCVRTTPTFR